MEHRQWSDMMDEHFMGEKKALATAEYSCVVVIILQVGFGSRADLLIR